MYVCSCAAVSSGCYSSLTTSRFFVERLQAELSAHNQSMSSEKSVGLSDTTLTEAELELTPRKLPATADTAGYVKANNLWLSDHCSITSFWWLDHREQVLFTGACGALLMMKHSNFVLIYFFQCWAMFPFIWYHTTAEYCPAFVGISSSSSPRTPPHTPPRSQGTLSPLSARTKAAEHEVETLVAQARQRSQAAQRLASSSNSSTPTRHGEENGVYTPERRPSPLPLAGTRWDFRSIISVVVFVARTLRFACIQLLAGRLEVLQYFSAFSFLGLPRLNRLSRFLSRCGRNRNVSIF